MLSFLRVSYVTQHALVFAPIHEKTLLHPVQPSPSLEKTARMTVPPRMLSIFSPHTTSLPS